MVIVYLFCPSRKHLLGYFLLINGKNIFIISKKHFYGNGSDLLKTLEFLKDVDRRKLIYFLAVATDRQKEEFVTILEQLDDDELLSFIFSARFILKK